MELWNISRNTPWIEKEKHPGKVFLRNLSNGADFPVDQGGYVGKILKTQNRIPIFIAISDSPEKCLSIWSSVYIAYIIVGAIIDQEKGNR